MNEKDLSLIDNFKGLLTFKINGEYFCSDMANIVEIINPSELNQEENINSDSPHINLGVVKIAMIDLYKIFGLNSKQRTEDDRIIVVEINNQFLCFLVDKICNIYSLDKDIINEIEFEPFKRIIHLTGILKLKKKNLFLLDFNSIASSELKKVNGESFSKNNIENE